MTGQSTRMASRSAGSSAGSFRRNRRLPRGSTEEHPPEQSVFSDELVIQRGKHMQTGPAAYPCLPRSMATARAHRLAATSGWMSRGTRLRDFASGLGRSVEGLIAGPGRRGIAGKPSHI